MGLNEKFDMDSVEEYDMEKELQHFLNCEDTDYVDADKNIPMEICEFYFEAIGKLLGRDERWSDAKNVRRFFYILRPLTDFWCQFKNDGKEEHKQLEDTLYYRIAYIYRNSTCISSAVAHHFGTFLHRNWNIRNELLKKKELRICSVGGGSPSDVVALVKVLESRVDVEDELDIHVSIIGGNKKWHNTCLVVLRCLARFRNTIWKTDFLQADLFQPFSDEVTKAIASADIVSMVKFFSELGIGSDAGELKAEMFQRVHKLVQPGSLVFCLDLPHSNVMYACGGYLGQIPQHRLLYEAVCDLYTLEEAVVERHFRLYGDEFPGHMCNTALLVLCRVWLKPPTNKPGELLLRPINDRFVKIQEQLAHMRKEEEELRRKSQLLYESEVCSLETVKDLEMKDLEMKSTGPMTKKKLRVIRVAESKLKSEFNSRTKKLKREFSSRTKMINSFYKELMRSPLRAHKELLHVRKSFVASKRDAEGLKLKIHQQYMRELLKSFKNNESSPLKSQGLIESCR